MYEENHFIIAFLAKAGFYRIIVGSMVGGARMHVRQSEIVLPRPTDTKIIKSYSLNWL